MAASARPRASRRAKGGEEQAMDSDGQDERYGWRIWQGAGAVGRLAAIACAVGGTSIAFAYTGGWIAPDRLSPTKIVDRFEAIGGRHEGFRRNHAKGMCIAGNFASSGQGAALSSADLFRAGQVPVIGRFSFAGGDPFMADTDGAVRALGLQFRLANGEEWRTAMINLPVFPASTPEAFYGLLAATAPVPGTGKPDPALVKAFMDQHPDTVAALGRIKSEPPTTGFSDARYHALNTLLFRQGSTTTPVRISLLPVAPPATGAAGAPAADRNRLFDALAGDIQKAPLRWTLVATIGKPGDSTRDPTKEWPSDRQQVTLGTLTIDRVSAEAPHSCRDLTFDPLVLPAGIGASDDPILNARSGSYSESLVRRSGETKHPSAVTAAEIAGAKR